MNENEDEDEDEDEDENSDEDEDEEDEDEDEEDDNEIGSESDAPDGCIVTDGHLHEEYSILMTKIDVSFGAWGLYNFYR